MEDATIGTSRGSQRAPATPTGPSVERTCGAVRPLHWSTTEQIFDYHTVSIPVPGGFSRMPERDPGTRDGPIQGRRLCNRRARLQVQVQCETPGQFIGVAKYDLYLLESEGNFSLNYFKGSIGIWFRLVIALAIAIACFDVFGWSAEFPDAMFLFLCGFFLDFIIELASGTNIGGGPLESLARLDEEQHRDVPNSSRTSTVKTLQAVDGGYRWLWRRVISVIPDVDRYGMTDYVAQGFSIGPDFLLINFITLLGYVLPWLVAAYYLMKAREIAA